MGWEVGNQDLPALPGNACTVPALSVLLMSSSNLAVQSISFALNKKNRNIYRSELKSCFIVSIIVSILRNNQKILPPIWRKELESVYGPILELNNEYILRWYSLGRTSLDHDLNHRSLEWDVLTITTWVCDWEKCERKTTNTAKRWLHAPLLWTGIESARPSAL